MNYIGIDTSKDTFHAAFDESKVIVFDNSPTGIKEFIQILEHHGFTRFDTNIGTEATGVYHLLLSETLRSSGWQIKVINPLITNRMFKSDMRYAKTDRHDAKAIRKALMSGAGYTYTDTPDIMALKALVQEREALCRTRAEMKQRIHAHKIKERASGLELHDSFSGAVKVLTYEMKEIEERMVDYASDTQILLRSIPGIGKITAAALVASVGDIRRFATPEKLVAYIGLDPRVYESGTSIHGKGYITKRGNRYLRYILFNAAFIGKRRNPDLKRYMQKKLSEGKHYYSALVAVERKLVHLIWAVWSRGMPFESR